MGNNPLQYCVKVKNSEVKIYDRLNGIGQYYVDLLSKSQIKPHPYYNKGDIDLNRLMCILEENHLTFEDMIVQYQNLLSNKKCKWKRAQNIFKGQTFFSNDWQFQYQQIKTSQNFINTNFINAIDWFKKHTQLLNQICVYHQISKSGMYRFFFCLSGEPSHQIIIDSLIPVNHQNQYLFSSPKKGGGIWMILLEKALAKATGSYSNMCWMSPNYIISQISGFPLPELYVQGQKRFVKQLTIQPKCSKYLKIGKQIRAKAIFVLWFVNQNKMNIFAQNIVIQIIQTIEIRNETRFQKMGLIKSTIDNKVIISSKTKKGNGIMQMIALDGQQQKIHFFNNSGQKISVNLVAQADQNIFLSHPQQASLQAFELAKKSMIINQYQKYHNELQAFEAPQYKLRFMWMEHRGIFCIKNKQMRPLFIKFLIKKQFESLINFEDDFGQREKQLKIKPNCHDFFIIIRNSYQQYGQFYELKIR